MSRPAVVIPLFLLCVGAMIAGFYWTRTDPDDLYSRAQPLMQSDDPADWEKAWTDYLEPLSREYPDRYAEEVKAFRARTEPLAELRKAQAAGRAAKYTSEAERFYQEGVRLAQAGDFAAAKRTWERVAIAYAGVESEARWVELARQAAARLSAQEGTMHRPAAAAALRASLQRAKALQAEGKTAEAEAIWDCARGPVPRRPRRGRNSRADSQRSIAVGRWNACRPRQRFGLLGPDRPVETDVGRRPRRGPALPEGHRHRHWRRRGSSAGCS